MRATRGFLAAAGAALLLGLLPQAAHSAQKRVLLVTEARGFVHESIGPTADFIRRLGARSRAYNVFPMSGAAALTRARLRRADAVVFAHTSGELPLPSRSAFLRFVRRGGAFIATHSGSDTFHEWPEYQHLLGAEFHRHGAVQPGRVLVDGRRSPITRGLGPALTITDEFYEFTAPPLPGTRVLLRLDPGSVTDEMGQDLPLVWTRRYGRGRVFYDALGHVPDTWERRAHRLILSRGLAWALRVRPGG
jgi:type 1 glutamine amidotransferase